MHLGPTLVPAMCPGNWYLKFIPTDIVSSKRSFNYYFFVFVTSFFEDILQFYLIFFQLNVTADLHTALLLAVEGGHVELVDFFLAHGATDERGDALHAAIAADKFGAVTKRLLMVSLYVDGYNLLHRLLD